MTVSVRYAASSKGDPYSLPVDAGTLSPGETSAVINTYISHDGTIKITNCAIYILPYSAGVYLGALSAQDDYDMLLAWGDASYPAVSGGGLYVNMNSAGGFQASDYQVFRTGSGDSLGTAIPLPASAIEIGAAVAGEIAPDGEAHLKWRLDVPASHLVSGIGYVDTLMYYSATS